ncbi:MAG: Mur ligase family protein, partial [Myxococcota bacterium]
MRLSELLAGIDAHIDGADVEVTGLAYDSRRVRAGDMFAALVGVTSDGHKFVEGALARGASAVLCERAVAVGRATRIVVGDTRRALAHVARTLYGDPAAALAMVGITGTNGKTTTAQLVQAMLSAAGRPCGVVGTLGSHFAGTTHETGMTTPESVDLVALVADMRRAGAQAVAMEVSSHALAQRRVDGLAYDAAVFASFSQDHLDYHGDMAGYFAAKRRLFDELRKPQGVAV